jgi:hypothetical protein
MIWFFVWLACFLALLFRKSGFETRAAHVFASAAWPVLAVFIVCGAILDAMEDW